MSAMTAVDVARRFVERINVGDLDDIVALMTEDHRFIDFLDTDVVGLSSSLLLWRQSGAKSRLTSSAWLHPQDVEQESSDPPSPCD